MSELLPCPFCGSVAEIYAASERRPDFDGTIQGHWVADCTSCNANIEFCNGPEDAKIKWNRRANQHPLTAEDKTLAGVALPWVMAAVNEHAAWGTNLHYTSAIELTISALRSAGYLVNKSGKE